MKTTFINTFLNYLEQTHDLNDQDYDIVAETSLELLEDIPSKFMALMETNDLLIHFQDVSNEDICINLGLDIMRSEEGFFTVDFIEEETALQITELIYENFKELYYDVDLGNKILYIKEEE